MLYFLILMALALGAVGFIIDRMAGQTLMAREAAVSQVIDIHFADLTRSEREKFDAELTTQAQRIGNEVTWHYYAHSLKDNERYWTTMRMTPLGMLGAGLSPLPTIPIAVPVWQWMPFNRRVGDAVARGLFSNLHLEETPFDDLSSELVMVTVQSFPDRVYRSRSLEGEKWDSRVPQTHTERFEHRFLQNGTSVRVIGVKSPIPITRFQRPRPTTPSAPGPRIGTRPEPPEPPQVPFRTAYIQCGRLTEPLEQAIEALESRRHEEKAEVAVRTQRDRRNLRTGLAAIGAFTFACLIGGGLLLVHRGLRPLNTLSEAVAKVSEKDFHLPIRREQLSVELLPIHDRLTETLGLLQKAFEHDKQAVADISHELRTPVAALLATLDVSLRKPRDAESYRQTLVECRSITKQLQNLVERVMLLASLDATPAKVSTSEVDAVEIARNCAAVIRPLAEAQGLTMTVDAPQSISLRTDSDKLREVLLNLLHNAVEYNTPGGKVELSVSNGGPRAVFAVKDTGIGMDEDVKSRIFERFYRADASRTATGIHAGLGLAIVKECVDRLGGTISVESTPGAGSQFKIELPA